LASAGPCCPSSIKGRPLDSTALADDAWTLSTRGPDQRRILVSSCLVHVSRSCRTQLEGGISRPSTPTLTRAQGRFASNDRPRASAVTNPRRQGPPSSFSVVGGRPPASGVCLRLRQGLHYRLPRGPGSPSVGPAEVARSQGRRNGEPLRGYSRPGDPRRPRGAGRAAGSCSTTGIPVACIPEQLRGSCGDGIRGGGLITHSTSLRGPGAGKKV